MSQPGYYPSPYNGETHLLRWWDGSAWTSAMAERPPAQRQMPRNPRSRKTVTVAVTASLLAFSLLVFGVVLLIGKGQGWIGGPHEAELHAVEEAIRSSPHVTEGSYASYDWSSSCERLCMTYTVSITITRDFSDADFTTAVRAIAPLLETDTTVIIELHPAGYDAWPDWSRDREAFNSTLTGQQTFTYLALTPEEIRAI